MAAQVAAAGDLAWPIGGLACILLLMAAADRARRGRWKAAAAILLAGAAVAMLATRDWSGIAGENPEPVYLAAPREEVPPREYANPADATRVLLHGIIADGILNLGREVSGLAEIGEEIGLPVTPLTEGEEYALAMYRYDGWGRPFRFERKEMEGEQALRDRQPDEWGTGPWYEVASDGEDGVTGTADDISISVRQRLDDAPWEWNRSAYYIRRVNGKPVLLVHRARQENYRSGKRNLARELTGGGLFDAVRLGKEFPEARYEEFVTEKDAAPLVMYVLRSKEKRET